MEGAEVLKNTQDRNVGNRGDVAKHIALVALARLLRARNAGPVRHVETHTFRMDAPLPGPWTPPASAEDYAALEAPWIAAGRYRCSAGLAVDVLGPEVRLALAEAHGPTRAALAAAIAGLPVDALVDALVEDADALAALPDPAPMPVLIHVDPFDDPLRYWSTVEHVLARWRAPAHDACVLAFGHDRARPMRWPPAPAGLLALGRHDDAPYYLAAWASPALAEPARRALAW